MALSVETALAYFLTSHKAGRLANVYLIHGAPGSGKEELARKLAALILHCLEVALDSHPDFHKVQPISKSRRIVVEQIRLLECKLQKRSTTGLAKVAIIQEADRLAPNAANAFLKTLEEPPASTYLVLLTVQPETILPTVLSRCMRVPLYQKKVKHQEKLEAESIVARFNHCLQLDTGKVTQAFQFVKDFQTILGKCKEKAAREIKAELDQDKQHYQNTTDGTWLEERMKYLKAMEESISVRLRHDLIAAVKNSLAARLRASYLNRVADSNLVVAPITAAQQTSFLQQIEWLDHLQWCLDIGVSESLAFEACFIEIFSVSHQ